MTDNSIATDRLVCRRPRCAKSAQIGHRGLCRPHYAAHTAANRPVPAAPIAAHVARLRAAGLGWQRLQDLTGLSFTALRRVDRRRYVLPETARKILAIPVPDIPALAVADGALVDATGTRRRLQALIAAGWTNLDLADAMGYHKAQFGRYLLTDRHGCTVTAGTARRAAEVFTRLQLLTPPDTAASRRSRLRAARRGWPPPLAWDEDTIDNPCSQPHTSPNSNDDDEFAAIIADHRALGRYDREIAARMGVHLDTLQTRLRRAGIPRNNLRNAS